MCHRNILNGAWMPGHKVPSVRELSVQLSVNMRTVLSAFEVLESEGVLTTKRGLGFFLTDDAKDRVLRGRREDFFNDMLPAFISEMKSLGITSDEIVELVKQYE